MSIYIERAGLYSDEQIQVMLSDYKHLEANGKLNYGFLRSEVEDLIEKSGMPPHEPTYVAKDLVFECLRKVAVKHFEQKEVKDNV